MNDNTLGMFIGIIISLVIPAFTGWLMYLTKQVDSLKARDEEIAVQIASLQGKLDHIAEMLNEIRYFCREKGGMIIGPEDHHK